MGARAGVAVLGVVLLVPVLPYAGETLGNRSAGSGARHPFGAASACPRADAEARQQSVTYLAHSGTRPGRPVPTPAALQSRRTVNKVRAYYRDTGRRDLGQELVAASTCTTAAAAADPAAEQAVAAYRSRLRQHADALVPQVQQLAASVRAGDRGQARSFYGAARASWEQVRPVAAPDTDLEARTGWDRIGRRLGRNRAVADLAPVADGLVADARDMRARVVTVPLSAVAIGRAAKELFDDVATDATVLEAEVDSAWTAYRVLRALVSDPTLVTRLDTAFAATQQALSAHRRGDHPYGARQRELTRMADALAGPLSHLAAAV
jgi:iron uptake system EfeUOB component EfeO/EfeM